MKDDKSSDDVIENVAEDETRARKRYMRSLFWSRAVLTVGAVLTVISICSLIFGGFKCVFRTLTGIPCPGCGMTRALLAVLSLNFSDAFYYHPLFFVPPLMAVCAALAFISRNEKRKKMFWALLILLFAAFTVCWAIRLACGWRG